MKEVVLATLNPGKVREMADILRPFGILPLSLRDFQEMKPPPETGDSFLENARIKALYYSVATTKACIADDSGLEVDVLDGAPGICSSRFAGEKATDEENIEKLLDVLAEHPRPWRARFVCAAVYVDGGDIISSFEGVLEGEIIPEKRGLSGFGYDPVFHLTERGLTVAEITIEEKNIISHRRKAIEGLMIRLREKNII
jgi:XTP/dITP diphosphohydrolase